MCLWGCVWVCVIHVRIQAGKACPFPQKTAQWKDRSASHTLPFKTERGTQVCLRVGFGKWTSSLWWVCVNRWCVARERQNRSETTGLSIPTDTRRCGLESDSMQTFDEFGLNLLYHSRVGSSWFQPEWLVMPLGTFWWENITSWKSVYIKPYPSKPHSTLSICSHLTWSLHPIKLHIIWPFHLTWIISTNCCIWSSVSIRRTSSETQAVH